MMYACEVHMSEHGPRLVARLSETASGLVRVPLAKLGSYVKGKDKFSITKATLSSVVANFRKRAADTVIDYEHASEYPADAKGGPIPAAGWLKAVDDEPDSDGILYGEAEFTSPAQTMIQGKEYRYLSPVISWGVRDKHTGEPQGATLLSVALTNRPFLEELPALALSDRNKFLRGDAGEDSSNKTERSAIVKVILTDRVARTVRVVNDDGTDNTLTVEGLESPAKVVKLSDVKRDNTGRFDFNSIPTDSDTLVASDVIHGMQVQSELDDAVEKGTITPAQRPMFEKIALSDLAGFRDLLKTMKPQVDLSERGSATAEGLDDLGKVSAMIESKISEKVKADPKIQYHDALKLVASENPELNRRYTELGRKRMNGREE